MNDLTKARMVVMSHLSDAQESINYSCNENANDSINFAKYVILQTKGDLTQEIDPNEMYKAFLEQQKN